MDENILKLIPTVASYFAKAWYRGTGDAVRAQQFGEMIEAQLRQMPPEAAAAYIKSATSKKGFGLQVKPDEHYSYSTMNDSLPEIILNPDQIYDTETGNWYRTDVPIHELGHDTDAKIRKNTHRDGSDYYGLPASVENNLGYWLDRDISQGKGLPAGVRPRITGTTMLGTLPDDFTVEGMYYDQLGLDPTAKGFYPGWLKWSGASGHHPSYSSAEAKWAEKSDPNNRISTPDARHRTAQSEEGFAELGALLADTDLAKNYNTTAEALWPSGTKAYLDIVRNDPRRVRWDYIDPTDILTKHQRTLAK